MSLISCFSSLMYLVPPSFRDQNYKNKDEKCNLLNKKVPCFKKHENWVSRSAERKRLLSMVVHGKDKVDTRILRCPYTLVYKSAHCKKK